MNRRPDPRLQLVPSTQEALDRITCVAGETLNVEVVCASLVDADRNLVVSSYGQSAPAARLDDPAARAAGRARRGDRQ